jgi:hypothetical protein
MPDKLRTILPKKLNDRYQQEREHRILLAYALRLHMIYKPYYKSKKKALQINAGLRLMKSSY